MIFEKLLRDDEAARPNDEHYERMKDDSDSDGYLMRGTPRGRLR